MAFSVAGVIRHLSAALCFYGAWRFLSVWYLYLDTRDYLIFASTFLAGSGLALWSVFIGLFRNIPRGRIVLGIVFLFLCLPWAEWLDVTHVEYRENWSQQLLLQFIFLYVLYLLFVFVPQIPPILRSGTARVLEYLSRPYLFWLPPILFFFFTAWISLFVFQETPLIQDTAAHLFQAKIFLQGRLYAPEPPLPEFFSTFGDMLVMQEGRWFSMYQPGLPLLLAAAILIGAQWLFSPFLGAAAVTLWMAHARRWYDVRIGVLFGWLAVFSPFLLLMSSTIMVHLPEMFLVSAVIYVCRAQTEEEQGWRNILLLILLAWVMLVRSFSSLPLLMPVLVYTAWKRIKAGSFACPVAMLVGMAIGGSLLLYFQVKTTGHPFVSGYALEYPLLKWGFGGHPAFYHTPVRGLANVSNNLLGINTWLTGWPAGCIVFVFMFLIASKLRTWDLLLLAGVAALIVFYFQLAVQDLNFGPRYYFSVAPIFLLWIARSIEIESSSQETKRRTYLTALLVVSFFSFLPSGLPRFIRRYDVSATYAGNLKQEIQRAGSKKMLVFLEDTTRPYFVSWNDPFLRSPLILCRDLEERNSKIQSLLTDYQPVYFRAHASEEGVDFRTNFRFFHTPDPRPPGSVSLFQLAFTIQATSGYPDRDLFHLCYADLFLSENAGRQLSYLQGEFQRIQTDDYRAHFRRGLIHIARMLLLPKAAFEKYEMKWYKTFSWDEFRQEYDLGVTSMQNAGEIGKPILFEMERVQKRIDRNHDGTLSDEEIHKFLSARLIR